MDKNTDIPPTLFGLNSKNDLNSVDHTVTINSVKFSSLEIQTLLIKEVSSLSFGLTMSNLTFELNKIYTGKIKYY